MTLKQYLAGAGASILLIAGFLGLAPDDLTPEEILQIEAQAQELFGGNANNVKKRIFNEMRPATVKMKGKDWELTGMHFKTLLKENADDGWEYIENGKKLGFVSTGMAWDGDKIKTKAAKVKGEISELTVRYDNALGEGIDIKIVQDNYHFQKIIEIDSLASLGEIPEGAEYLEFSFKMSGDFNLPEGEITERLPFGENSFLHPVRAWDFSEPTEEEDPNLMSGAFGEIDGKVLTKKIPVAWLLEATFPISTDTTITYGSENVFELATTTDISVAMLDSTHVVVSYVDNGDSDHGKAVVGSISGLTISWGTPVEFNAASTFYTAVTALDSTHFVVAYQDVGNSGFGTAIIGVTDGSTTINSYGSELAFSSASTTWISIAMLDSTHFVLTYRLTNGTAIVGVTDGSTAISSYGTAVEFNAASTHSNGVAALDSTHFVVGYRDTGNSHQGTAIIGVTDGSTAISSYGSEFIFNAANTFRVSAAALDSTHFVVVFKDDGGSVHGIARVGVTDGSTAISSFGAENTFNAAASDYMYVAALDSSNFVVAYKDVGGDGFGGARIGAVTGTTIDSYGDENLFNSAVTDWVVVAALSDTHFAIAYQNEGNSDFGTGIIGTIAAVAGATGNFFQFF